MDTPEMTHMSPQDLSDEKEVAQVTEQFQELIIDSSPKSQIFTNATIQWIEEKLDVLSLKKSDWDETNHSTVVIQDFLSGTSPKLLYVIRKESTISFICHELGHHIKPLDHVVAYFLRPNFIELSIDNIKKEVQYGTIGGKGITLATLENVMKRLVERQVMNHAELNGHYHRCMTSLTDTLNVSDGVTILYCPTIETDKITDIFQNKEKLQIYESIIIHWTRQIKEAMNTHDNTSTMDNAGLIDEIDSWKIRAHNLLSIQKQLESDSSKQLISILEKSKSNYVSPLLHLAQQLGSKASEANDNLKFLETTREQSIALRSIEPNQIVTILPDILKRIRFIWNYSSYFNTIETLSGLLRKISNEIIRRFREYISIIEILDGNIEICLIKLNEAINSGNEWKRIYHMTAITIERNKDKYNKIWNIDIGTIFAQLDAFIQRCRDLIDVCEGQMQFVRKSGNTGGQPGPLPFLGGTKSNEILEGIKGIQQTFERILHSHIRQLDYPILDIRMNKWHDDCNIFKSKVKDLEVMYTNVINVAFEGNGSVAEGVTLVETFYYLAKRDAIRKCVEKKSTEMVQLFLSQVQKIRMEMESSRNNPPLRMNEPQYAGSALWAHGLGELVNDCYNHIIRIKHVYTIKEYDDVTEAHHSFLTVIKDYKISRHSLWLSDIESKSQNNGLIERLDKPLLKKIETSNKNEVCCNFDEELLSLFAEVNYWEKLHGEFIIPYYAHDLCNKKDQTRHERELVMQVVRSYNDIVCDINSEEKRLFGDHLRKLNRHLSQGMQKLTWQSKTLIELFVKDCVVSCHELQNILYEYQQNKKKMDEICKIMSTYSLIRIDKNQILETEFFEKRQYEFKENIKKSYIEQYNKIMSLLQYIYKFFKEGSPEVQREWKSQLAQVDKKVEQSLKHAVKKSLQDLAKVINGDSKTDPVVIFAIQIQLTSEHCIYVPNMIQLTQYVNILAKDVIDCISSVGRVRAQNYANNTSISSTKDNTTIGSSRGESMTASGVVTESSKGLNSGRVLIDESNNTASTAPTTTTTSGSTKGILSGSSKGNNTDPTATTTTATTTPSVMTPAISATGGNEEKYKKSYYEMISDDPEILRIVVQIMNGMSSTSIELQKYLSYWDKYKSLWELDKDIFIKKYAKSNRTLEQFDSDISHYKTQQIEISGETNYHSINFVRVDCNALRESLLSHCTQCHNNLTTLLNQNGLTELMNIIDIYTKGREELTVLPTNLDELSMILLSLKQYKDTYSTIRQRYEPIRNIYNTLLKYEVSIKEDEIHHLSSLDRLYEDFGILLLETQVALEKSKTIMKRDLDIQLETYNTQLNEIKTVSQTELPYDSHSKNINDAIRILNIYKEKLIIIKQQEQILIKGLQIFGISYSEHKDLTAINHEISLLTQIWTIRQEWLNYYEIWKSCNFQALQVEEIEGIIGNFIKKVGKLGREMKSYEIWNHIKQDIDYFRDMIPLIQDLRSHALRPRHWIALEERLNIEIHPESIEFTLNKIIELGFYNHKDYISELSLNANKEVAIEKALAELEIRWSTIEIDITSYKDKYYKIKSTDDLLQVLEDDSVALSTMKASKFYLSFKSLIDYQEKKLSTISEVIDSILCVQRQWIYLENIFMAGGDIAKQLPQEFSLFIEVNTNFMYVMNNFATNRIAEQSCLLEGLLSIIQSMDTGLEKIQKCLDQYLETKRMIFPRFYFVSDDDLLEILGQSKDPVGVQKHVKKCFEGIKSLKLIPPTNVIKVYEATTMLSPDGETAPFAENVIIDGAVELWLVQVEKAMRRGIAKLLSIAIQGYKGKKDKWVHDTIGQLLITTGAIVWTNDCTKALIAISQGEKSALKQQKKKQISYLNKLTEIIRGQLSKVDRNKVVALITMEIHNRDVMEKMIKANCNSISDFEWLSQLRFLYSKDSNSTAATTTSSSSGPDYGKCEVQQMNSILEYSYEYQGNNGRLVVTPLTDRCVLTLITAMYLNRGGNPLGPAGTGKTETVKDLGKNLAKYVVVINCSDGMDYKSVGRIFSGLVQSGSWGCFDEFNRIKIEVISVVAMQILSILNAMSAKVSSFSFMGTTIPCNLNCGIFITMNPGYAGRTELPDNLKALMRPVAMMQPDLTMIAEVMLASEGFNEARVMAKKTVTLYSLMIQQLSKQDHYDYGLRNLKAVLNMAGQLKRTDASMTEESILMRALRDMNLPKFIKDDERLFRLLLSDLFPGLDLPVSEYGTLYNALTAELKKANLQCHDFLLAKILQFYDSRLTRHCNMLVGDPLGGKSTAWKILAAAQTSLSKANIEGYQQVIPYIINPKSIELNELYGAYDLQTFEWKDGILSTIFKTCAEDEKLIEKWILFDGPIDAMWIESMNSVMDDNKILTLINGDRIPLTNSMSLVFETQDLRVASPATVSRAGMIYMDGTELGWKTYVESWLNAKFIDEEIRHFHLELFDKWVPKVLKYKNDNCYEPVKISSFHAVMTLCSLYDALEQNENHLNKNNLGNEYNAVIEKVFVFILAWSIGASVDEISRKKLNSCLSDIDSILPPTNTIYDYYVDITKNEYVSWENKLPTWRYIKGMSFYDMIIPTMDTIRNTYIVDTFMKSKKNICIVGATGTGKTVLVQTLLKDLPRNTHSQLIINFSAATTSSAVQEIIEGPMEKRSKDKLGPTGGKKLIVFIDDFNMPKKTSHESPFQPPLELIRLYMDYQGWYDRIKCAWKYIVDTQLIVAMGHPGGGRNQICERTKSRFCILNTTFPADNQIIRIFDTILLSKFNEYDHEIKSLSTGIATATLQVYKTVSNDFLTTPEKFHYLFNIRDVAKVIQGILMTTRSSVYTVESMIRVWVHECQRVFADRLIRSKSNDESKFRDILSTKMSEVLSKEWTSVMSEALEPKIGPIYCGLLTDSGDDGVPIYEEVTDYKKLKNIIEEKLENYNLEPKFIQMDLALFRDAIMHICRIHRVLIQPRGNMMLVGIGGSGRTSLAKLSAYIANMSTFSIEITKNYRLIEFRDDLKKLYLTTGGENKKIAFIFNDTQIKEESFLEDINNILSSGIVPNLFAKDELGGIYDSVRKAASAAGLEETPEILYSYFIERVRSNLHILLCMSPIGDSLRNRCRMYPGLVNCTTIDWFHTWPAEALQEVGLKFLIQVNFPEDTYRIKISTIFSEIHLSVIQLSSRMLLEMKRHNYVTPTNYLELVKGYKQLLNEKSGELVSSINKLANGLAKLEDAKIQVETLSKELEIKKVIVAKSQHDCEDLLVKIVSERRLADDQRKQVEQDSERIGLEAIECKAISDDAEADLAIAMPALEKAMQEVDALDKSAISEVKAYSKPPELVETVLKAVMTLFNKPTDWANAKKVMSESNFIQQIKQFDKDSISASTISKIKKFVDMPSFKPEEVKKVSGAACALCIWVHAIYLYANVAKEVEPKRNRLREATESLAAKQAALKEAQFALEQVIAKLAELQVSYDKSVNEKNQLREEAETLEAKLDRADKLVNGLSGEYIRWQASISQFNTSLTKVYGDSLMAAAFLSYSGPFETTYRSILMKSWTSYINIQQLPMTEHFNFTTFLAKLTDVRDWNIQGLPKDDFSTENGVISTRGNRWPLMIDPQGQANRWIRNMEGTKLRIIDLKMTGFLREVENAVQYGFPVLLQDILEEIDPALEPVLSKSILKIGNREIIRIGDKELDYSHDFRLYITTKLSNPHYTPEISTKATVVNFAVVKAGLEAQLLGIVVQKEEPSLEQQKSELTVTVAAGKKKLVELEDEILRLLSESKGSLLDDEGLVNTLQQSKITSEKVTQQLIIAEETEKKIDEFRSGYRSAAIRAALAYFVLDDMSKVDPMYQFSLDSYVELFNLSIDRSHTTSLDISVQDRCEEINIYHTYEVYKYTCRGLFEAHKLLFSLQLCFKIIDTQNLIVPEEFHYFNYGGGLSDRSTQKLNNYQIWLPQSIWDNIIDLDKLSSFQGLITSLEEYTSEWKIWYMADKPEDEIMPGNWSEKTTELQKLCILRAFRIDRILYGATKFITAHLGSQYIDPPSFDLKAIYDTSSNKTPLIFVLSPGVDPTASIFQLATTMNQIVENCALGQGQEPVAVAMIERGLKNGNWVFLANCHLMLSWMPQLEKIVESLVEGNTSHINFRLWLSSSPDPFFPISILQRGIKMTTEPPKGIRSNMLTLYNTITEEQFHKCYQQMNYKKLLFCLVWFHSILLERRKFKSLGFNISYDFNESDFAICHDLIITFLNEYNEFIPFDAMKYLIAEANYGGRVTDDWDRRLVNVYIGELFNDECIQSIQFMLSDSPDYFIPPEGDLKHYKEAIRNMPQSDHPSAFGQHVNSSMAASIDDANNMLNVLVSLQPRIVKISDEDAVDPLAQQCTDLLQQIPECFDVKYIRERMSTRTDPDPLKTVLYQELDRYNSLLSKISCSLTTIIKVTQGTASVTAELEEVMLSLTQLKVPRLWSTTYPSLKPLGSWILDLNERIQFFTTWIDDKLPIVWWLPAMTYPTSFLTAILQVAARANGVSIDSLSYETPVLNNMDKSTITTYPKDGVYVTGVYLEGAAWNLSAGHLEDSKPMELICKMPIMHFKPVEGKKKGAKGYYTCPLYIYPIRSGTRERPSYVASIDIKTGQKLSSEYWTKRGVAMLLSTSL